MSLQSHRELPAMFNGNDGEYGNHPLKQKLQEASWNNIPIPVRDLIEMLTNYVVYNEKDFWERKALINERMFKLQHMCAKIHSRVKMFSDDQRDMKNLYDKREKKAKELADQEGAEKYAEFEKKIEKDKESTNIMITGIRRQFKTIETTIDMNHFNASRLRDSQTNKFE